MKTKDIMERLGRREETGNGILSLVGLFGAGLVIGAGAALLLAPKPGSDLRRDIGDRFTDLRERTVSRAREAARALRDAENGAASSMDA